MKLNVQTDEDQVGMISNFSVSRQGFFTCPLNTAAIFASDSEQDFATFDFLNDVNTVAKILALVNKYHLSVLKTNVKELKDKAGFYLDSPTNSPVKYILFDNQQPRSQFMQDHKLVPLLWLSFENQHQVSFASVCYPKMWRVQAKHIYVKLIDCENRMNEFGEDPDHNATNIDIRHILLSGSVQRLSEIYAPK